MIHKRFSSLDKKREDAQDLEEANNNKFEMESKCDGGWWTTEQKALTSKTVLFRVTEVSSRTTNLKKSMTNNVCLLFVVFVVAYLSSLTGLIIREIWQIFYFVLWIYPAVRCTPKKMIIITLCPITKKNVLHAYIHVSSSVSSLRLVFTANKWYNLCSLRQLLPSSTSQGRRNREQSLFLSF